MPLAAARGDIGFTPPRCIDAPGASVPAVGRLARPGSEAPGPIGETKVRQFVEAREGAT
jgi:hypothetical protein